jgi:hypothetical protein
MDKLELPKWVKGHLEVIHRVTIHSRSICESDQFRDERFDLMDAVHNTATFIANPWTENIEYIWTYYFAFDKKWNSKSISLIDAYNSVGETISIKELEQFGKTKNA